VVFFQKKHILQPPRERRHFHKAFDEASSVSAPAAFCTERQRSSHRLFHKELQTSFGDSFISFTAFESIYILPRAEGQLSGKLLKSRFMFGYSNSRVMPDSFIRGKSNTVSKQTCGCKTMACSVQMQERVPRES